jgi:glycosyltransferase involved in cell wall biosynthesis
MDSTDEEVFRRVPAARPDTNRFTLISHATVEERYDLDTAIDAVALVRNEIPVLVLKIYGEGSDLGRLHQLADWLGGADRMYFSDAFVPIDDLRCALSSADVGVVAIKRDVFRDVTLAAKMFDFIAMGLPMVVSRTRSVEQTFPPDCFERFESGNPADLARALRRLHEDPDHRALLATRAAAADPYRWAHQWGHYLSIVAGLLADAGLARQRRGRSRRQPEAVSAAAR